MVTDKNRKKYDARRVIVVKKLANKHEVTENFVRLALTGRRESETAQAIRREYPKLYAELEKFLSK